MRLSEQVVGIEPVGFSDLKVGQKVGVYKNSINMVVKEIATVIDVDVEKGNLGTTSLPLQRSLNLITVEPRVLIHCPWGCWNGYWYPLKSLFVTLRGDGCPGYVLPHRKVIHLFREGVAE